MPTRRGTSKALQLLAISAIGNVGGIFGVGLVRTTSGHNNTPLIWLQLTETLKSYWNTDADLTTLQPETNPLAPNLNETECQVSKIEQTAAVRDFEALSYTMMVCVLANVLAAVFFLATAFKVARDKKRVEQAARLDDDPKNQASLLQ